MPSSTPSPYPTLFRLADFESCEQMWDLLCTICRDTPDPHSTQVAGLHSSLVAYLARSWRPMLRMYACVCVCVCVRVCVCVCVVAMYFCMCAGVRRCVLVQGGVL